MSGRHLSPSFDETLIVGLGSLCGDDSVGWCIASTLAAYELPAVRIRLATSPSELLDWLDDLQHLIICDACVSSAPVGQLHRWVWPTAEIEPVHFSGSHDMSLPTVLALADRLQRLPPAVTIWAVSVAADRIALPPVRSRASGGGGESTHPSIARQLSDSLSQDVAASVPRIVAEIRAALQNDGLRHDR